MNGKRIIGGFNQLGIAAAANARVIIAAMLGIAVGASSMWALLRPSELRMSDFERVFYDSCLASSGNIVACDAALRILRQQNAKPATLPTAEEAFPPPRK
jgi:hypothetical protein